MGVEGGGGGMEWREEMEGGDGGMEWRENKRNSCDLIAVT